MTKAPAIRYPSDDWGPLSKDPWGLLNIPSDSPAWTAAAAQSERRRRVEAKIDRPKSHVETLGEKPDETSEVVFDEDDEMPSMTPRRVLSDFTP